MESEGESQSKPFMIEGKVLNVIYFTNVESFMVAFNTTKREVRKDQERDVVDDEAAEDSFAEGEEGDDCQSEDGEYIPESHKQSEEGENGKEEEEDKDSTEEITRDSTNGKPKKIKKRSRKPSKSDKRTNKVRLIKDEQEFFLKGDLCREITSPYITYRLLVAKIPTKNSSPIYKVIKIDKATCKMPITYNALKNAIVKSKYFGSPDKSIRTKKVKTFLDSYLEQFKNNKKAEIPISVLESLINTTDEKAIHIFTNLTKTEKYYEMANKLGSDITRDMTMDEIYYMLGSTSASLDVDPKNLFERLCFKHPFTPQKIKVFTSIHTTNVKNEYQAIFQASLIYHDLLQHRKYYFKSKLTENMEYPWNDDAFAILVTKNNLVYTGIHNHNNTRYIQLIGDYQSETNLSNHLLNMRNVAVIEYDADEQLEGEDSYFAKIREQIVNSKEKGRLEIITSVKRRELLCTGNLSSQQGTQIKTKYFLDALKSYEEKFNTPTSNKTNNNNNSTSTNTLLNVRRRSLSNLCGSILTQYSSPTKNLIDKLVIDRAHLLSADQMCSILSKYSDIKHLILAGSSIALPKHPGTWFASLCKIQSIDSIKVYKAEMTPYLGANEGKIALRVFENTDQLLNAVQQNQSLNILVAKASQKEEVQRAINPHTKNLKACVYSIYELDYDSPTSNITAIIMNGFNRAGIIKAIQCSSLGKNTVYLIASGSEIEDAYDKSNATGNSNLGMIIKETFANSLGDFSSLSPVNDEEKLLEHPFNKRQPLHFTNATTIKKITLSMKEEEEEEEYTLETKRVEDTYVDIDGGIDDEELLLKGRDNQWSTESQMDESSNEIDIMTNEEANETQEVDVMTDKETPMDSDENLEYAAESVLQFL